VKLRANEVGNNLKALRLGIEGSLKRLRTTYVDVYYLHYWDLHTSVEEIMDGLHVLVQQGLVLYLVHIYNYLIYVTPSTDFGLIIGCFRRTRMVGRQSECLRSRQLQDAFCHLPGPLFRHAA
jgi:hypothetical protein